MKIHGTAKGGAISKKDFGVAFGGAAAEPTSVCNDIGWSGDVNALAGYIRATPIDVSSLPSSFTPTHLGYTCKDTMSGNIAIALYSDNSGQPEDLICQTASHAITGDGADPVYLETVDPPSTSHSGTLWIGFITSGVPSPQDYTEFKGVQPVEPENSWYMTHVPYPAFPDPFVSTGATGTDYFFCLTAS